MIRHVFTILNPMCYTFLSNTQDTLKKLSFFA